MVRVLLTALCVLVALGRSEAAGQAGSTVPNAAVPHITCTLASPRPLSGVFQKSTVLTDHFVHTFDAAAVDRAGLMKKWPQDNTTGLAKTTHPWTGTACAGVPAFVLETAYYLEQAWAAYDAGLTRAQLQMPTPARGGQISVNYQPTVTSGWLPGAAGVPMQFQHESLLYGEAMNVSLSPMPLSMMLHQQRTAHELFHFIQGKTVGATKCTSPNGLWWIEATADYAACDVVWPELSGYKGGGDRRMEDLRKDGVIARVPAGARLTYPYLLEKPLYTPGAPTNDHNLDAFDGTWDTGQELEYDKAYFIQFLVNRYKLGFFKLNNEVLGFYKDNSGQDVILTALKRYLPVPLTEAYGEFVSFCLLSADGPIAGTVIQKGSVPDKAVMPLDTVVKPCPTCPERTALQIPASPITPPLAYTFTLEGGYSAKMWALELQPPTGGAARAPRVLSVGATEMFDSRVQVFVGPKGTWLPGQPTPKAELRDTTARAIIPLKSNETLYIIASGRNTTVDGPPPQGRATIFVAEAPSLVVQPLTRPGSDPIGSLVREFKAVLNNYFPAAGVSTRAPDGLADDATAGGPEPIDGSRSAGEAGNVTFRWSWRNMKDGGQGGTIGGDTKRPDPLSSTVETTQSITFPAPGMYAVTCVAVDAAGTSIAESRPVVVDVAKETKPVSQITVTPSKTDVVATEIFDVSATVADAVKAKTQQYAWSGPLITESADHLNVKMQFRPRESGARTISLTAQGSPKDWQGIAKGEAAIIVRPALIAGTGSDLWEGGTHPGGFNVKRTPVVRKRKNPDNFMSSPGQEVDSGNVTANLAVAWMDSCPATDEELRKSVEATALWRWLPDHAQFETELKTMVLDGFKGYAVETKKMVTRYGASEYQDMGFPGAGMAGRGIVRKGNVCLEANYSASGGGMSLGKWWDDMPFLEAHAEAAWADIRGILGSLRVVADGKFTTFPHPAVTVPGSPVPAAAPGMPPPAASLPPIGSGGASGARPDAPRPPQPDPTPARSANLARGKPASQSSTAYDGSAGRAVDGNSDGDYTKGSVTHTAAEREAWWQVDLGVSHRINRVAVWNRADCCAERLAKFYVLVSDAPFSSSSLQTALSQPGVRQYYVDSIAARPTEIQIAGTGRYVRVQLAGTDYLSIAELEVIEAPTAHPPQPMVTNSGSIDPGAGGVTGRGSGQVVAGHVYFGKGIIGSFNRGRLPQTWHRELPFASGVQRFDLAKESGAARGFAALAVSLMNYACQGEIDARGCQRDARLAIRAPRSGLFVTEPLIRD